MMFTLLHAPFSVRVQVRFPVRLNGEQNVNTNGEERSQEE